MVITQTLSLNKMPEDVQDHCRQADIVSKSMLLQIARQSDAKAMHALIDQISGQGITREEARRFNREDKTPRRTKNFTFAYEPDDDSFRFRLTFPKAKVHRDELIETLERVLTNVRNADPEAFETRRTITTQRVPEDDDVVEPPPVTAFASSQSRDRPARLTPTDSLAASCRLADRLGL